MFDGVDDDGAIPWLPRLSFDANNTECQCADLQHEDYSPLYGWFNYIVVILFLPGLSIFGCCTNLANVFIYSRTSMTNSANTYLLFLAISDLGVIVTGLFMFWIDSARAYIPQLHLSPYPILYILPIGYMSQTCSIYFTVAAAVDCYLHVVWSHHRSVRHGYCTTSASRRLCTTIVFVSITYNSIRFLQYNLRRCTHGASGDTMLEICQTPLLVPIDVVYNVYLYTVLMTLLPFVSLFVLNVLIIKKHGELANNRRLLKRIARRTDGSLQSKWEDCVVTSKLHTIGGINNCSDESTTSTTSENNDGPMTLIMVVVMFLACNTLALVINIVEQWEPEPLLLNWMTDISNVLVIFNSSVNFAIYMTFNHGYRQQFILQIRRLFRLTNSYCLGAKSTNATTAVLLGTKTSLTNHTGHHRSSDNSTIVNGSASSSSMIWHNRIDPTSTSGNRPTLTMVVHQRNGTRHLPSSIDDEHWDDSVSLTVTTL